MSTEIFSYHAVKPFKALGLTSNFWTVHLDILIATWIAMGCLLFFALVGRYYINKKQSIIGLGYQEVITIFIDLCKDSFPTFNYRYFAFITALFFFTFFSCLVGILPFIEEATKDLNTTLAIGLTSFLYVQAQKIKVHGMFGYLKEFTEPFIVMLPIHVVGELSKIASMSFRLFGNILGGGVILGMIVDLLSKYKTFFMPFMAIAILLGLVTSMPFVASKFPKIAKTSSILLFMLFIISWVQILFGIVEGVIQSFVVTMLTTTYLAIGTFQESSHEHKEAT